MQKTTPVLAEPATAKRIGFVFPLLIVLLSIQIILAVVRLVAC